MGAVITLIALMAAAVVAIGTWLLVAGQPWALIITAVAAAILQAMIWKTRNDR